MKNYLLALSVFALASCSQTTVKEENTTKKTETEITIPAASDSATTTQAQNRKIGMPQIVEAKHIFSDPTNQDNFRLELNGMNVLDGKVKFTITNLKGQLIYQDSMQAADLEASMVYEMKSQTATQKQREDFILKRMHEFFDEKNFSTPAIAPNDSYDPAFGEETAWNAIKNDKNAVGFNYLTGKENGRRLAYSKLRKKVMLVGFFGG